MIAVAAILLVCTVNNFGEGLIATLTREKARLNDIVGTGSLYPITRQITALVVEARKKKTHFSNLYSTNTHGIFSKTTTVIIKQL